MSFARLAVLGVALTAVPLYACGGGGPPSGAAPSPTGGDGAQQHFQTPVETSAAGTNTPSPTDAPDGASTAPDGSLATGVQAATPTLDTRPRVPTPGRPFPGNIPPSPTQQPPSGLTVELSLPATVSAGDDVVAQVRLSGTSPRPIAAFNFDIVYDQRLVRMEAPEQNEAALQATGRDFACTLPPPSADVEGDPATGRARLVCFSFGSGGSLGFQPRFTLATVRLRLLERGSTQLSFENARFFDHEGANLGTVRTLVATVAAR